MSAYQSIQKKLQLDSPLAYTKDWSVAEDFLELIVDYCFTHKPTYILECSSGLSTLVLARCCQLNGHGQVYSLENGEEYALKTQTDLKQLQLNNFAQVLHAPLEKVLVDGDNYDWYQPAKIPHINIDMLVIDGPPGFIQNQSRYPAIPLLHQNFSEKCAIFLDDAGRDDEKIIVNRWLENYPLSNHNFIETERGCSVLTTLPDSAYDEAL